jgi:RadC-like JAB domain
LLHNHNPGHPTPPKDDVAMAKGIATAAEKLGILIHDHTVLGARVMRACTASGCMVSLFAAALLACGPFGTRGPHCQPRRLPRRRADGAFPKAFRAAARISLDKVGSSTARARISAPIIPASVVIARLRRLATVRSLKRRA